MSLRAEYLEKLAKKISLNGDYKFGWYLSIKDIKQILRAFEELEERIRVLEKAARAPCSKCDEYPCFKHFE